MHNLRTFNRSAAVAALLLVLAALAATLATGAFSGAAANPAAATRAASPPSQGPEVAAPNGGISTIPPAASSAFAAFRRPETRQDAAVASEPAVLGMLYSVQQASGVNPSLARVVYQGAETTLALVPGNGVVCLVQTGSATAACDGTADAAGRNFGIVSAVGGPKGVSETISGVLPDGAHSVALVEAGGARAPVTVTGDGGYSVTPGAEPKAIVYTDAQGAQHTETISPPLPVSTTAAAQPSTP
jgi:hypothetical protein